MATQNENKLSLIWDKRKKDFVVKYPRRCDGALVMNHICDDLLKHVMPHEKSPPFNFRAFNFLKELEGRGYDLSTIKFSIELKKSDGGVINHSGETNEKG